MAWQMWSEFVAMENAHIAEERQKRNEAIMLKLKANTERKMKQVTAAWRSMTVKMENEKRLIETLARVLTKWRLRLLLWAMHVWSVSSSGAMVSTVSARLLSLVA